MIETPADYRSFLFCKKTPVCSLSLGFPEFFICLNFPYCLLSPPTEYFFWRAPAGRALRSARHLAAIPRANPFPNETLPEAQQNCMERSRIKP